MRVEGPGKALEFNPSKELEAKEAVVRQIAGDRPREENAAESSEKGTPKREQLESAVEISNKAMEIANYGLQFKIHEKSGRVQVKVIDTNTEEVIREIPPEQMLEISARISEMISSLHKMVGVLVNELV